MNKKLILSVAALALLSGCMGGASSTNAVTKGATQKSGFMGLSTNDPVMADTPAAFKAVNQVVIGNFTVGFATYKTESAKAGGGLLGNGMGGKSTAESTLVGIDDATMQKITDQAYAGFLADLKAKGYTVVDRAGLLQNPQFAKTKPSPSPYEDSKGGLFGASSKTRYFAPSSQGGLTPFIGDIGGLSPTFGFGGPLVGALDYAKKSGVKVLNVVYVLDFANAESYGGSFRSTSAITVGQGVTVVPGVSKVGLWGGDGGTFSTNNGTVKIGQPITSMKEFATVADSTSGADRGMEIAANVIGVIGGVGTNSSRDYTFTARPADYQSAASDALAQANAALTGKMASLK